MFRTVTVAPVPHRSSYIEDDGKCLCGIDIVIKVKEGSLATSMYLSRRSLGNDRQYHVVDNDYRSGTESSETLTKSDQPSRSTLL